MNEKTGFFPMFMDIRDKKIVFFGGGRIATRRVKVLCGFDTSITVVAPDISKELSELSKSEEIIYIEATYEELAASNDKLFEAADIIFACTNNEQLNHEIYLKAKENRIWVNNCSNHKECDFYFPGIVQKENVVVGINAGGKAHSQAKTIREKIEELLK